MTQEKDTQAKTVQSRRKFLVAAAGATGVAAAGFPIRAAPASPFCVATDLPRSMPMPRAEL